MDEEIKKKLENNECECEECKECDYDEGVEEKLKAMREKLKHCQKEKQEYLTGWQRAQADFINYKRRQEVQAAEWSKMFGEGIMKDILSVLDAMDLRHNGDSKEYSDGILKLREYLLSALKKHGLEEMKSVGEKFNLEQHEAIEEIEGEESDMVVEEVQKGYWLNGKVLRAAKVKVSK